MSVGKRSAIGYLAMLLLASAIAMVVYAFGIGPSTRWLWVAGAPIPFLLGLALTVIAYRGRSNMTRD